MSKESLEPHELIEQEGLEPASRHRLSNRVAVTAAVLAVLASICSLQAERTASESIIDKNEAVLWQTRASDEWAYRQAKSIKLRLDQLPGTGASDVEHQRAEITASETRARDEERRRDEANRAAIEHFEQHHRFAVGTSLLQIAIVLETVAVVLDRESVWLAGLAIGAVGALALANGFLGLV